MRRTGSLKMLVFLTDGVPTIGETDVYQIIKNVTTKNAQLNARIFCFGVGYDVNTILLDTLSQQNGGFSIYVEPGESLETEIAHPVLREGRRAAADRFTDYFWRSASLRSLPTEAARSLQEQSDSACGALSRARQGDSHVDGPAPRDRLE
ncbi:MAG: hypothetical protein NZ930_05245 [Candidatus Bipolaricaulota bacterium]|nr:hypothetical protein [Candidatus Bipolaricaulota bacterium]MDW8030432.1 hypothetical protein [Candidatus Bipolaricaulota bacterium]